MTSSNGNIFRVTGHLCGEFTGPRWIPHTQRPVTRSFDVFFDLRPNKWLSKLWWGWWFKTPSCPLWRHCNDKTRKCYEWYAEWVPNNYLTHLPLVLHICVIKLGQHWFSWWLVACSAPRHYLNQWWLIVNWTLSNKLQWNSNLNTNLFIREKAFQNVVCEMAPIVKPV